MEVGTSMNRECSDGQTKTVKVLLYISSSGSYHQRMEETISDLLVKQDSLIMMGHREVRQRIGPTGLTWWPSPIQLYVVRPHHSLRILRFILQTDPVINLQSHLR